MRGLSLAAWRTKKVTISLSYYNDQDHVEAQLNYWAQYDDLVKFQIMDETGRASRPRRSCGGLSSRSSMLPCIA